MKLIRGHKSHYNIETIFSICENDYENNLNLNDYIVLKPGSKLGFLELVLKKGLNFIKKVLTLNLLMIFTLHNNQYK